MAANSPRATFPAGGSWYETWAASFGPVTDVEGLPMVVGRRGWGRIGFPVLRAATNPHSIHYDAEADVALDPDLPARALRASGAAMIVLDYLAADSRLLAAARGWAAAMPGRVTIARHAVTPVADCGGSYDAWAARRSKRLRQRLRRAEEFARAHGMRCTFTADDPVDSGLLAQMLALEQAGWKGRGGTAILDDGATARFYTDVARRAAADGVFRGAMLWHGDRLAAFEYGIRSGTRLFLLKVGYDERFAEHGIGYLLAARHIARCCDDPEIDAYDKMGNGMTPAAYKIRFADRLDYLHRVTIAAPDWRGRTLGAVDALRAGAKAWRDQRRAAA